MSISRTDERIKAREMSVPTGQRTESKAEYLNIAMELDIHTKTCCRKFPKSAMFITTTYIVQTADSIGRHVAQANARFPRTQFDIEYRREHLQNARGLLDWLDFQVQQAYAQYGNQPCCTEGKIKITPYAWQKWSQLIGRMKSLVEGVLASDRKLLSQA